MASEDPVTGDVLGDAVVATGTATGTGVSATGATLGEDVGIATGTAAGTGVPAGDANLTSMAEISVYKKDRRGNSVRPTELKSTK